MPDSKTGKKSIRLNAPAIDILNRLPRLGSNPYVIVGLVDGGHLVNLQKPWRYIRGLAGLDDVRKYLCGNTQFALTKEAVAGRDDGRDGR